jgi:uncharacterized protein (TIGR04255 family)
MVLFSIENLPITVIISTMTTRFSNFEGPPLEEMAMGVQFDPLQNLHAAHLGLFWSRIQAGYPHTEDHTPVPTAKEETDIKPTPITVSAVALTVPPLPRCWFLTEDKTELIQVQRERFLRNWRRVKGDECYPRFDRLARAFMEAWQDFLAFINEKGLGPLEVNQCDLTYINHIDRGSGWEELGKLEGLFPFMCARASNGLLPPPEVLSWQSRYKLPEGRGRLHVEMTPIFRPRDMKLAISLNLVARGAPLGGSPEQISDWFDLAHEWVVKAFAELTGPSVHQLWGMRP